MIEQSKLQDIKNEQETVESSELELIYKIKDICNKLSNEVEEMRVLIDRLQPNDALTRQSHSYSLSHCRQIQDLLLEIKKAKMSSIRTL